MFRLVNKNGKLVMLNLVGAPYLGGGDVRVDFSPFTRNL